MAVKKERQWDVKYHTEEPCVACGAPGPNDLDHVKTRGSGGCDESFNLLPSCRACHTKRHNGGFTSYVKNNPRVRAWLLAKGWQFDSLLLRWTHPGAMRRS